MSEMIINQVVSKLQSMPDELQQKVLNFAQGLQRDSAPAGVTGQSLLRFAGMIPADDLAIMQKAIEENCEQVDLSEW